MTLRNVPTDRSLDRSVDLCERCKRTFLEQIKNLLNPAREAAQRKDGDNG